MKLEIRRAAIVAAAIFLGMDAAATAQAASMRDDVRAYRTAHEKEIVEGFTQMLAIPNVATNVPDIEKNAAF